MSAVIGISAIGTRGKAKGKTFVAKKDSLGYFILNKKTSANSNNPTNNAVNKVAVSSLAEAVNLLSTNEYLIHLVDENGRRALRMFAKVNIEYI